VLLDDPESYRIRGDVCIPAVFDEAEDAVVVGLRTFHAATTLPREARTSR
jgi:hypothetical protein